MLFRPGISLAESHRVGLIAERLILQVPEVKSVGRRTGRAELDEHAEGVHSAEIDVDLNRSRSAGARRSSPTSARASPCCRPTVNVGQPISHRLDHMLSGVRAQIALKIFGDDLDTLRALAEQLRTRMEAIPGIVDLQVERQVRIPQVQVAVDYDKAGQLGVTPAHVTEALGIAAQWPRRLADHRRQPALRRRPARWRIATARPRDCRHLMIETPAGRVPLSSFASIVETDGPNQIQRENTRRRIVVLANTDGSDMARIIAERPADRCRATSLPEGYFTSARRHIPGAGGGARASSRCCRSCRWSAIFIVLYSRYQSAVLALIIMGNVPLALIGSVARPVDRRPAAVGRHHDRLHHARRHQRPQRHSQDQPLHQSGAARGRDASAAT